MNGVQHYTIVHFGGDIVHPKIGSIVSYVGGSTKLNSLRAHSSYEDFVTLLEETSKIRREDSEFWFEPQPEQVKDLLDFRFKSAMYTEDPYDFSKEFNNVDLYRDRIELKNHIRTYTVINKFNLEHVLSNEYKIVVPCKETDDGNAYKVTSSRWVASIIKQKLRKDPNYKPSEIIDDMQIYHNIDVTYNLAWRAKEKAHAELYNPIFHLFMLIWHLISMFCHLFGCGVAYANHVESWNNVISKVRDLPIHMFIEELRRIYSEISYTYREEAEKSQARFTSWATNYCESRKFVADSLTCRVRTLRYYFQITSYGRTDYVNIEDGTCFYRWRQTMGIPSEHGVCALGLANVDLTTRVSEYFTNNTYKTIYEPIWILIRGIEQWKILKTDPRVRAPILTV
ncbi:hypothetical protein GIB67_017723 [Kingdonia uniflora]|uniref:Uncharacterized protein n=1 Tax=Kingdonia uniflora TaxID=39325 RepID=A0A7J7NA39_9MAGN|nr:hypothetical protein GIB67_017723 [Kingdonia uniflora]